MVPPSVASSSLSCLRSSLTYLGVMIRVDAVVYPMEERARRDSWRNAFCTIFKHGNVSVIRCEITSIMCSVIVSVNN